MSVLAFFAGEESDSVEAFVPVVPEGEPPASRQGAALPQGDALIAYEPIIDDERRANVFGLLMSLNMLIETPEGRDATGAEIQQWLREAGFRETYVQHLVGPNSMTVGIK